MSIALMVITDAQPGGGVHVPRLKYLHATMASLRENVRGFITHQFIVADCAGNTPFLHAVEDAYSWPEEREEVLSYGQRLGFSGAIQAGWAHVRGLPEQVTHVFQ